MLQIMPASAGEAWFDLKLPDNHQRRSDANRAAYLSPDLASLPLALPADANADAALNGTAVYSYLRDIVAITLEHQPAGQKYRGRIAGNAAEQATADYLADQMRAFGLTDVHTETVQGGRQWWPEDWQVTLIGDSAYGNGTTDYTFTSAFPAVQLEAGAMDVQDLEAELVYVGLGRPVDLLAHDLSGKIAVVHSVLQSDPFFQSARGHIEKIVQAGAIAVITVVDGPGNHQYALEQVGSDEAPCFLLGGHDGRFLEAAIAAAGKEQPLRARISMRASVRESWLGKNVLGLVPGRSDEYLLITAHLDGYFEGANDNAGGLAAMLALAQYFSDPDRIPPERNLLFVGTSAHHEFSDGAKAFINDHPEIVAKAVLVLNIEHPSSLLSYFRGPLKMSRGTVPGQLVTTNSQGWRTLTISNGNERVLSFFQAAAARYGVVIEGTVNRRPNGDAYDFFKARIPVVQLMDANLWFHSSGDQLDTISPAGLERTTRLFADVINGIDDASATELGRRKRK
ncbi:MAG: M28 family peptidase [Gammaproteobacteria bacterium]|nr:M28 family peptidase [Gammaproteobacteria bacterium]